MGLFDRAFLVLRANLNSMVNQAEDPAKVLEQTLVDMEAKLLQLRQAVALAIATQKRTERQRDQARATAQEWYNRAELALRKGDEDTARQALTRRQTSLEAAQAMESQREQQRQVVGTMKENMHRLEIKLAEAKTKKDLYIARARSAEASHRLQEMLGDLRNGGAKAAFDHMEQRVLDLEARSEALQDLDGDALERQFAALEGERSPVDRELEAMKARLGGTAPAPEGWPPVS
ncbi:MAG: PspA/IM30 family protein [Leptolyngbya sp.]|nr:PspA/IM30 family protein [Leptolyngbya sp.]